MDFPADNFRYWFTESAAGTQNPPFSTDAPVPAGPTVIYTPPESQFVTDSTNLGLAFKVIIARAQKTGRYSLSLILSLVNRV